MKITEELLWEYAAKRVTPDEVAFIEAAMQNDKALADEIARLQFLQAAIRTNLEKNMAGVSGNTTLSILKKVNELEEKKTQRADDLLIYIIFIPLVLLFASSFIVFFKDAEFNSQALDPFVVFMVIVTIVILLFSTIGARYMLYKMNSHRI
jgi:hypothetical protein